MEVSKQSLQLILHERLVREWRKKTQSQHKPIRMYCCQCHFKISVNILKSHCSCRRRRRRCCRISYLLTIVHIMHIKFSFKRSLWNIISIQFLFCFHIFLLLQFYKCFAISIWKWHSNLIHLQECGEVSMSMKCVSIDNRYSDDEQYGSINTNTNTIASVASSFIRWRRRQCTMI